jgi:hypothetical protein
MHAKLRLPMRMMRSRGVSRAIILRCQQRPQADSRELSRGNYGPAGGSRTGAGRQIHQRTSGGAQSRESRSVTTPE